MERSLYIENYRNIGIDSSKKLILNRTAESDKMGNLVILIGENNSGKSNVLDAIETFGTQKFQQKDETTLDYSPEKKVPKISLVCKVGEEEFYSFGIDSAGKIYPRHTLSDGVDAEADFIDKQTISEFVHEIQNKIGQYNLKDEQLQFYLLKLSEAQEPIDNKFLEEIIKAISERVDYVSRNNLSGLKQIFYNICNSNKFINTTLSNFYLKREKDIKEKAARIKVLYKEKYGYELVPKVYRYTNSQIRTSDLSNKQGNQFIYKVLHAIGISPEEITNVYASFNKTQSRGILNTEEDKLNKLLVKVADDFNAVYFRGIKQPGEEYRFRFNLESTNIFFSIYRGNKDLNLDYQSTGFAWFFNLYFNLLCNNSLKTGDIIIMDEPATNLHIGGQIELRKFLKTFAVNNGITLVVATHSPFLIDLDYLDEIRLISRQGENAEIYNDFNALTDDAPDTLSPIKRSLTVNNHVLLDPDVKVIFVEGITDYNYMVTFKRILDKGELVFLPINGLGKNDDNLNKRHIEIVKALQQIKKHGPILMVDGDGAGKAIKDFCADKNTELKVFALNEADPSFVTIESLFNEADNAKFGLKNADGTPNKHSSVSSVLKTFAKSDDFSKTTVNNFKKLFSFIDQF